VVRLSTWVSLLLHLKQYAINTHFKEIVNEITALNTTSAYDLFAEKVFGRSWRMLALGNDFHDISRGISIAKECFTNKAKGHIRKEMNVASPLFKRIGKVQAKVDEEDGNVHPNEILMKLNRAVALEDVWEPEQQAAIEPVKTWYLDARGVLKVTDGPAPDDALTVSTDKNKIMDRHHAFNGDVAEIGRAAAIVKWKEMAWRNQFADIIRAQRERMGQ